MKVYLGKYKNNWISPYTIIEKVLFWKKDIDYRDYEKVSDFLMPFCEFLFKVLNKINPRIEYIKLDRYDTWNVDTTLARIILPMLIQHKKNKMGHPSILTEESWNDIIDKMIWSFNEILNGEDGAQFHHHHYIDWYGMKLYNDRIQEGLDLFGRHYRNLWE